tara:strand:- start:831 stop:1184 length:354 start_codon:yes stop_codon:yes gene_type:complete
MSKDASEVEPEDLVALIMSRPEAFMETVDVITEAAFGPSPIDPLWEPPPPGTERTIKLSPSHLAVLSATLHLALKSIEHVLSADVSPSDLEEARRAALGKVGHFKDEALGGENGKSN